MIGIPSAQVREIKVHVLQLSVDPSSTIIWPNRLTDAALEAARSGGIQVALTPGMLKLLGSYALAKLLGFGLVGAIVIYALLSLVTR